MCNSRTPQGVRGLKCKRKYDRQCKAESHPARGAWIEMRRKQWTTRETLVAPRKGCVD